MTRDECRQVATFPSELGWMALVASESTIEQVVFPFPSAAAAQAALDAKLARDAAAADGWSWLVARLQDFAAGRPVDFRDVPIDTARLTPFQRRVVRHCRAIPYGQTLSYGQLAAQAGSPGAARAAGSTMAGNRLAIIVPCHRVINADGRPGRYGTAGGAQLKRRLLEMEQRGRLQAERTSICGNQARHGRR